MEKIANITLITALFLVAIIATSFIWGQNTNRTKELIVEKDIAKKMERLIVNNDLQKHGIEVIAPVDTNFDSELRKYIGSEDSLIPLVESAKPFVFFIKNNSPKEIVGVSLRWKFADPTGKAVEISQSEANPGVLMGIKPIDPAMIGKTSLINSKATKFFTYFNDIVGRRITFANMRLKNPSIKYNYQIDSSQFDVSNLNSQKENFLRGYTEFSVSLDGIVFDDGTFVGADKNFFFDSLSGEIQARKDTLTALLEAQSAGRKDGNILDNILSNTSNISVNLSEVRSGDATRERVFDFSYKTYLMNLRKELVIKRSRLSDDYIVQQLKSAHVSDFVMLHKES